MTGGLPDPPPAKPAPNAFDHPLATFFDDLLADFSEYGADAIERMREDKPAEYIKLVMTLLPREFANAAQQPDAIFAIERYIVDPADSDGAGVQAAADPGA